MSVQGANYKTLQNNATGDTPSPILGPRFKKALGVCSYLAIGICFYCLQMGWDIQTAVYFIVISITTVGYGDDSVGDDSDYSKLFTICYVLFGIVVVFAELADAVSAWIESVAEAAERREAATDMKGMGAITRDKLPESDDDIDRAVRRKKAFALAMILLVMLLGGMAIAYWEDLSFITGLYWAFQTTTTVGYGDITLSEKTTIFATTYSLFSVIAVAAGFAIIGGAATEAERERNRRALLRRRLDIGIIVSMDKDGDGVDRCEFVCGMLALMGIVTQAEIEPWLKRFDELDLDRSGKLDADDLRLFAEQEH